MSSAVGRGEVVPVDLVLLDKGHDKLVLSRDTHRRREEGGGGLKNHTAVAFVFLQNKDMGTTPAPNCSFGATPGGEGLKSQNSNDTMFFLQQRFG